jgi:uncharacterized membrane protein YqjE
VATRPVYVHPDTKITDLISRLADDSKRLVSDEVRLARLEMGESAHVASRGGVWLGLAFGFGIIALVAFTVLLTTIFGHLTGRMWIGALIAGALEAIVGALLILRGTRTLGRTHYTLDESREELRATASFVRHPM